ncbi:NAD dependent epimerase/dehydratase [Purpureocillium lilacinum]|uniref:NAD dependent epimerase/dehydratase n=1 Tax=Purpureocillium lilacinum TaxID=33203 RepID=A0A179GKV3_PURLI|nr:NAD dependent epimerase/dehydratase [Purpureocillium lilacinum]
MVPSPGLDSWWWRFIENYVYRVPEPSPRTRTTPMQVICVGPPRSGTESLQQALLALGYDYTYHGWDIMFETPHRMPTWARLCRKKWYGAADGEADLTAVDFDAVLGHAAAVTDAAASVFAAELIAAYPEAKVVLNTRADLDEWYRSVDKTIVGVNDSWVFWLTGLFNREAFWAWHVAERLMWALLFRAPDGNMATAIRRNGKWIYREHCNMIRGLVPKDRLLEWNVGDGWEPLCKFLDKPVPDMDFPHANAMGTGWKQREDQVTKLWVGKAFRNMAVIFGTIVGIGAVCYKYL